jgi:hypothetical protein
MSNSSFLPHGTLLDSLNSAHTQANAQWDKLKSASGQLDSMRTELDKLVAMGDVVTGDDVLKSAGRMVAAGQSAKVMAGLLADMPSDGPSLQQWIGQQDARIRQQEQQVASASAQARHQVAVTGLHVLHAYGTLGEPASPQAGPGPASPSNVELPQPSGGASQNPLTGGA